LTTESFVTKVNSLDGCRIVYEGENGFVLEGKGGCAQVKPLYVMRRDAVEDASWGDIEAILSTGRAPKIIEWTTRICGYYSNLKNFNKSKIAENNDRHRGNYALPE